MRRPVRVSVRAALSVAVIASALVIPPVTAATDGDTTAPVGILQIGDGSGYSSSLTVTVHVEATDDVGVATVRVWRAAIPELQPYTPALEWTFPYDGTWTLYAEWRDAAGNSSQASATVVADTTPPTAGFVRFPLDLDPTDLTIPTEVTNVGENASQLAAVRFRTNSGDWGAPVPAPRGVNPMTFDWPVFDPGAGGAPLLGPRTVSVQVSNAVGLWSEPMTEPVVVSAGSRHLLVSGDVRTGHTVTLAPDVPDGTTFPSNATCSWEMAWGNDRSLYNGFPDESKGSVFTSGPPSQGFCGPWSVTLPWVPYRQFLVSFYAAVDGVPIVEQALGGEPGDPTALRPAVDSTSRHITFSSIPLVYVLPDVYQLTIGVPATYRAYTRGGAVIRSADEWSAGISDHAVTQTGGSSFTFIPRVPQHYIVCWGATSTRKYLMSACYDPPARYPDRTRPNTTTPVQRLAGLASATGAPTTITWTGSDRGWGIDHYTLQRSDDAGGWRAVALAGLRSTSTTQLLPFGHTYRYRVRAVDKAGNLSYWDYGPTFRPAAYQEASASIVYRGTWTRLLDADALGGAVRQAAVRGASATYTFRARDVAWVASTGPDDGKANVYVDSVFVGTIDLRAVAPSDGRLVFQRHWSFVGSHTLRIVTLGTAGRPAVDVDAFLVLR